MPESPTISDAFASCRTFQDTVATCPNCGGDLATFDQVGLLEFRRETGYRCGAQRDDFLKWLHLGGCRSCEQIVVAVQLGSQGFAEIKSRILYPPRPSRPNRCPTGVDAEIAGDYAEALAVLPHSAQAAAALARRCVQHILRRIMGIKEKQLVDEIKTAKNDARLGALTRERLDHVREIGNLAAHPAEDAAGSLIPVAPEEAEYTLDVVELMFEDLYVAPARSAAMQARIDAIKAQKKK